MLDKFELLYDKYKNDIFRLAYSYTKNQYDAEDITQNCFIKLYKNENILNDEEHLKKWLIRVCINECKTYFLSSWKNRVKELTLKEENKFYTKNKDFELLDIIFTLNKKERLIIEVVR